jgi:hypothetical protein
LEDDGLGSTALESDDFDEDLCFFSVFLSGAILPNKSFVSRALIGRAAAEVELSSKTLPDWLIESIDWMPKQIKVYNKWLQKQQLYTIQRCVPVPWVYNPLSVKK